MKSIIRVRPAYLLMVLCAGTAVAVPSGSRKTECHTTKQNHFHDSVSRDDGVIKQDISDYVAIQGEKHCQTVSTNYHPDSIIHGRYTKDTSVQ